MKKTLALILSLALAAGALSGCGGGTASSGSSAAPAADTNTSGMVVFDVWHSMEGTNGEAFEAMVKTFNQTKGKELGIQANSVFQGTDVAIKLKTLAQANDVKNLPDVALVYSASLPVISQMKEGVFVDDMFGQGTASLAKEDLLPNTVQTFSFQGKQVSMPFNTSTILLYYNKDIFKEVGLDPEKPPKTLAEVADYTEKLTVKNGDRIERYGFNSRLTRYEMVNFVGMQGDGTLFADQNNGRDGLITKITSGQEIKNVLTEWDKIAKTGGFKFVYDNQNEEFATGLNAMTLMSSARIGSVTNLTKENGMNWGVTTLPTITAADKGGACVGGASLAMFDRGDPAKKLAAWEFLQFAASPETQSTWSMATGYLPVNSKVKDLPEYKAFVDANPAVAVALAQMDASNPIVQEPVMNMQKEIDEIITAASIDLCEGRVDVDGAAKQLIEECNQAFETYNRANG